MDNCKEKIDLRHYWDLRVNREVELARRLTHKLVVSRNFLSIGIVLSCFYLFFIFILRNSQLESDVCRLPCK